MLTFGGITKITRLSQSNNYQPTLEYRKINTPGPIQEIELFDGEVSFSFIVDRSIAGVFTNSEIEPNRLIQLLSYDILSESPRKIVITSFSSDGKTYYRPKATPQPIVEEKLYMPISGLDQFSHNFLIKARIISKTEIKNFQSQRGQGKVFSSDIIDKDNTEITATFFNSAVDKFYDILQTGQVYLFSKGTVKFNNSRYKNNKNHYNIHFTENSIIEPATEDDMIKRMKFEPVSINNLVTIQAKSIVDVVGIITNFSEATEISTKRGELVKKRNVTIGDKSGASIEVTLWGEHALSTFFTNLDLTTRPILAIKGAQVSDYSTKSLTTFRTTQLFLNATDLPTVLDLQNFAQEFSIINRDMTPLTVKTERRIDVKPISYILDEWATFVQTAEKYYQILARITFIKNDDNTTLWYDSCKSCKKKVILDDTRYLCNKCNKQTTDCDYRYILSMRVQDGTGGIFVTAFDEIACKLLKAPASQMRTLQSEDPDEYSCHLADAIWNEYLFTIKVQKEVGDMGDRVKMVVASMTEVEYPRVAQRMLQDIENSL